MENIKYSLLIREYWHDFRRNFNKRNALTGVGGFLCELPVWVNILTDHDKIRGITMLMLLPGVLFLYFSFNTHVDLMPAMFYLLPLSRAQREQYIRRSTVVRILVPGAVCVVWFGLVSCFLFLETIGMFIGCAGSLLGCILIYLSLTVEHTHSYGTMRDGIIAFLLISFSFLGSFTTELGRLIWGIVFLLCGVRSCRLYRKFRAGCIRHCYYEAKASEGQKK